MGSLAEIVWLELALTVGGVFAFFVTVVALMLWAFNR
jgi:hypothetical protein